MADASHVSACLSAVAVDVPCHGCAEQAPWSVGPVGPARPLAVGPSCAVVVDRVSLGRAGIGRAGIGRAGPDPGRPDPAGSAVDKCTFGTVTGTVGKRVVDG